MRSYRWPIASFLNLTVRSRKAATLKRLPPSPQPFEEERVPEYNASHFYQVNPGDVVGGGRYSVISKLGWGRTSTVWLAKDLHRWRWQPQRYVAIKFNTCNVDDESIQRERSLLQKLSTADPGHRGLGFVRKITDSFELTTESGTHLCLVHEPLRETFDIFRQRFEGGRVPIPLLKAYARFLLIGLDYLHCNCNLIHTDLKLDNMLMAFENNSNLNGMLEQLQDIECLFKESSGRRIFQSRNDFGPLSSLITYPIIADFGMAREQSAVPIQPDIYRAPEVILGWGWSSSADIWNLGNLLWTLGTGADLFASIHSSQGIYDAKAHVAKMIALLGPPNPELIRQRSQRSWRWEPAIENQKGELCNDACTYYGGPFFDPISGVFLHWDTMPELISLHSATSLDDEDQDQKEGFVDFVRSMLMWDPEERPRARDLANHPWLVSGVPGVW